MILHIDMDAFFASVEIKDNPKLINQPVIVGGSPENRGVVAAANYIARSFGVHSAMPTAIAIKKCPKAIMLPVRMKRYQEIGYEIRTIFHRYTPLVEPLSLDEAFLDVRNSEKLFGSARRIGSKIKQDIFNELELVASVGVAPNKFLAKLASDLEKPDGFVVVETDQIQAFLEPLAVKRLWGVGKVTEKFLIKKGIKTIGQLRQVGLADLQSNFGRLGEKLWSLAHGIDERPVISQHTAKSISQETTFSKDIDDWKQLQNQLRGLTEKVAERLRKQKLQAKVVVVKIRFADFKLVTRSKSLTQPTDITQTLWRTAAHLLKDKIPRKEQRIRLLGVGVNNLSFAKDHQEDLYNEHTEIKQKGVDQVADKIRSRFGEKALQRGLNKNQ